MIKHLKCLVICNIYNYVWLYLSSSTYFHNNILLLYSIMSVTFSTDDYVVPEWSHMPHLAYHLQIIKEGSIIGNVNLKPKQFILVGRVNDLCDLFIDNPSVSRKHAIIQFKANDDFPYIYDLGGTHGTEVNRKKLPPRAYQKLNPFDMIKFGLSSRYYVMRCPSLEAKEKEQLNDADNKFQQILAQKNRQLSKQELKDKYLQMLENDPYFKANNLSKKLEGRQAKRDINGVDWGISDQYDVYSYRNQSQLQLQSDILRRLPGLDQVQLNKISDYETNLRKYEQIQSELNELCNKQKRQFGLEQKLRDKKQKLQKRFVEGLEMLEKSEDWIRVNIFGEKQMKVVKKERAEKEDDTFEDDEFFDRTLKQKGEKKDKKMQQKLKQRQNSEIFTTQDFWKLQKQLRSELKYLLELQNQEKGKQAELQEQQQIKQQQQQEDDLDAYMKQNNEDLLKQQLNINQQRIRQSINKVKQIKDYLIPLIGVGEVQKIQDEERGIGGNCQSGDVDQEKLKKQREVQNKIGETLNKLEIIRQIQQDIDEDDINILNYYKGKTIEQDDEDQNKNEKPQFRPRPDTLNQEQHEHEEPSRKLRPSLGISRDQSNKEQQQCFDLTKYG